MADVRLSAAAEQDVVRLLVYTRERFGELARLRYEALLTSGLQHIAADPERPGSLARPELGLGVRSYHLRHCRDQARISEGIVRRPRHLLLYRVTRPDVVGIGRILHDAMDLGRHTPEFYGDE